MTGLSGSAEICCKVLGWCYCYALLKSLTTKWLLLRDTGPLSSRGHSRELTEYAQPACGNIRPRYAEITAVGVYVWVFTYESNIRGFFCQWPLVCPNLSHQQVDLGIKTADVIPNQSIIVLSYFLSFAWGNIKRSQCCDIKMTRPTNQCLCKLKTGKQLSINRFLCPYLILLKMDV